MKLSRGAGEPSPDMTKFASVHLVYPTHRDFARQYQDRQL